MVPGSVMGPGDAGKRGLDALVLTRDDDGIARAVGAGGLFSMEPAVSPPFESPAVA